jgi:regulatory protein
MITIAKIKISEIHVSVELDNGETLEIPHAIYNLYKLYTGMSIDTVEYSQLKEESQRFLCKKRALDYLAIRMRTAAEMERHLQKKGFSYDVIRETVRGLSDAGYIDDYDFATRFINYRLNHKLVGKYYLAGELKKRGVSASIIRRALKESEARHSDIEAIHEIALRKYDILKLKKNAMSKLAYFLERRGFDSEAVRTVIERIKKMDKN